MLRQTHLAAALIAALLPCVLQPTSARAQEGPSLDVTLGFIRDKLSAVGTVGYVMNTTDTSNNNNTWANQFSDTYSNFSFNTAACSFSYHFKETRDGQSVVDGDDFLPLAKISDIQTLSRDDHVRQLSAEQGHPGWVSQTSPAITVLKIVRTDNQHNDIEFADAGLADRIAKAFAHAAQLCGGLKPEPF